MQFPLQAQEEFWKQMVADWAATLPTPNPTVPALSQLAIKLGGTILISHSQSGIYPFQTAALSTQGIAAIVSIEPGGCPTGDLKPYVKHPDAGAVRRLCRPVAALGAAAEGSAARTPTQMKKLGGKTELVVLPEIGIKGNSHMLMQDRNSLELADWLVAWLNKHVEMKKR